MATSVYKQILDQVLRDLVCLNLTGIDDTNIVLHKVNPEVEDVEPGLPGIIVQPGTGEDIPILGGTNVRDLIGYPVIVTMFECDIKNATTGEPAGATEGQVSQTYNYDRRLTWREAIRRQFINQRLTNVSEVWRCDVTDNEVVNRRDMHVRGLWAGSMTLLFWTLENRVFNIAP